MAQLRLFVFGLPRCERNGSFIEVSLHKAMALLVYLAVTNLPQSREALATLLWPEHDQREGRARLRRTLYELARTLGRDVLLTKAQQVSLNPEVALWMDVTAFQQLVTVGLHSTDQAESTRPLHLTQAASLYTEDFLSGFTLPDCPMFDEWQFFQRESLRQLLTQVLLRLISIYSSQQEWQQAISYARRWLALDALHEPAHRQLMQLYALAGQQSAALRQYQECVRLLDQELGLTPQEETTVLFEEIKAQRWHQVVPAGEQQHLAPSQDSTHSVQFSSLASPVVHTLPTQRTSFIGRADEMVALEELLLQPDMHLVTLTGPGGIGKTRLATQVAQRLLASPTSAAVFPHGLFFISLAPVRSASGAIAALAEATGATLSGDLPSKQQLLDYLRSKRLLLILDNVEHLLAETDLILALLDSAPGVKLVVTSREPLHVQEEYLYPVDRLPFPPIWEAMAFPPEEYAAVQLFTQRARQVLPAFSLAAEAAFVVRICRVVEGIPLAIELVAAWVNVLSCEQIALEIARNLDFLTTRLRDIPDPHRSMRAVFEHSWHLLSAAERETLGQLSVFRSGFRLEAAEQVVGASLLTIVSLVEKALLSSTPAGRYHLHELLRQFAAEHLQTDAAALSEAQDRHSTYYLCFLREREPLLKGEQQQATLSEIAEELQNVLIARNWALERGQFEALDEALEAFYRFFEIRGRYQEGAELFQRAAAFLPLTQERTGESSEQERIQERLLARLGAFEAFAGRTESAKVLLERCLRRARTRDDRAEMAFSLTMLAEIAAWQGRPLEAENLFRESMTLSRKGQDMYALAETLYHFANFCWLVGKQVEAKEVAQENLAMTRALGCQNWIARALNNLGFITYVLGENSNAERFFQESAAVAQALDDRLGLTLALGGLAWVWSDANTPRLLEAKEMAEKGLEIARESGHRFHIATRLAVLGQVLTSMGDMERAKDIYLEALAIARALAAPLPLIFSLNGLGEVSNHLGNLDASRNSVREALTAGMKVGLIPLVLETLVIFSFLLVQESETLEQEERGRQERNREALEVLLFVQSHPACWQRVKQKAARFQKQLESRLPADSVGSARFRAAQHTLEEVVAMTRANEPKSVAKKTD